MRGGGGALTRSGLDDGYYWDAERCQFTIEPLLPLAPKRQEAEPKPATQGQSALPEGRET